ncbi:MAG: ACT domain-containing protein [Clostridia bacterium]|nr:ACT domain-containing protein [Clostridia bacterium]
MTVKQISVFLENRYGQLHEITSILADADVDLKALNIAETKDYGILRLLVDDVAKATDVLIGAGCVVSVNPVQVISVPNRVGGLNAVLGKIAQANIDIEYMYSTIDAKNDEAKLVFKVDQPEALEALLA